MSSFRNSQKRIFTPLEKAADFSRRPSPPKVDGGFQPEADPPLAEMPPSTSTVREPQSSLTGFTGLMRHKRLRFLKGGNKSGIILLVVLWMMVIFSVLAIGMGRRTSIELQLAKHAIGKLKADYVAWAGFVYAADLIKKSAGDSASRQPDTLYQCGIKLPEGKTPEDILKNVAVEEDYFDIAYSSSGMEEETRSYYGLEDEERRVNINAIANPQSHKILKNLIALLGYDENTAEIIATSVADWTDTDVTVFNSTNNAREEAEYPYLCKNRPFDSLAELLWLKGVTPEIFRKLQDYVTIFPQSPQQGLKVNINTAPEVVLRAMGRSVANVDADKADAMARRIVMFRKGPDEVEFTADDVPFDADALDMEQKTIYQNLNSYWTTDASQYFRINVLGFNRLSSASSHIEAVVRRDDLSMLLWQRD